MATDLAERVQKLESTVAGLASMDSFIVPITTLEPEPYELLREIKLVIQKVEEDEYTATFFDANLGTAGCNPPEAIDNLKDLLISRFDYLAGQPAEKLGQGPTKQLRILRAFIRARK
jgi:hypothetical protein